MPKPSSTEEEARQLLRRLAESVPPRPLEQEEALSHRIIEWIEGSLQQRRGEREIKSSSRASKVPFVRE